MERLYNKRLLKNARTLRKRMTPEEKHLWYDFLKTLNVTVRRQQVIGEYIVDFYCPEAKLVIELDGSQHYEGKTGETDVVRDQFMRSRGIKVNRYDNRDVRRNFEGVCRDIYIAIYRCAPEW